MSLDAIYIKIAMISGDDLSEESSHLFKKCSVSVFVDCCLT